MTGSMLMSLLRFDEAELQLNKKGQISEKQKQRLQLKESGSKAGALFLGSIMLMSALVGIGLGVAAGFGWLIPEGGIVFRIIMVSVFGCFWTLIWGAAGVLTLQRAFANVKTEVKHVEGQANIVKVIRQSYNSDTHTASNYTVYELRIGGRTFDVRSDLPNVMKQGDVYIVHYASFNLKEKSNEILSVEWLAPASAAPAPQPLSQDDIEVVEWVKKGNLLEAIREHRKIYGSNYEDAKAAVNDIQMRLGRGMN